MGLELNKVHHGDCLDLLPKIKPHSIDMILTDPPYGQTGAYWDEVIDFESLWIEIERIIKPHGAIVFTAIQPFTSQLVLSNLNLFQCEWIWDKYICVGGMNHKTRPMRRHESILVFSNGKLNYYPKMTPREKKIRVGVGAMLKEDMVHQYKDRINPKKIYTTRHPQSIISGCFEINGKGKLHSTQKPVSLFEYLIETYTRKGQLVLDCCSGSGTTAIAAMNTRRRFICVEKEAKYVAISRKRIRTHIVPLF